jgi:carboxypeptidase C (cathepsin A)
MEWKGQPEFSSKTLQNWYSDEGVLAGTFKEVRVETTQPGQVSRLAFLTVSAAGHMVPMDKPEPALTMMTRWIQKLSFENNTEFK